MLLNISEPSQVSECKCTISTDRIQTFFQFCPNEKFLVISFISSLVSSPWYQQLKLRSPLKLLIYKVADCTMRITFQNIHTDASGESNFGFLLSIRTDAASLHKYVSVKLLEILFERNYKLPNQTCHEVWHLPRNWCKIPTLVATGDIFPWQAQWRKPPGVVDEENDISTL